MDSQTFWLDTAPKLRFPKLETSLRVDVLIVGGGITGLTAAYLLRKAGRSVAVLERGRIGQGETGHTTAHLTYATDVRLSVLVKTFGQDHALAAWEAGAAAITEIRSIVASAGIECELRDVPAFLVAAAGAPVGEWERLRDEAALAAQSGFDVTFIQDAPLAGRPAMRFANQFKFHPVKYVHALAHEIVRIGGHVFEETEVSEFHEEPRHATANAHRIAFDSAVLATHVPIMGNRGTVSATLLQTKLAAYSTYVIEARIPSGMLPEMLWWDTADPYLYLRVDRRDGADVVILGGEDHKTGQEEDTEARYQKLQEIFFSMVPEGAAFARRWSGQVIESVDGLPYIGEAGNRQFVATGFGGNGMTFGTLAGMMACDAVTGAKNPWRDLFAVERKTLSATWDYLRENSDYPFFLAKSHLAKTSADDVGRLRCGEGKIVRVEGHKAAAFRADDGRTHLLSAICPHLGCIVAWNDAERTWDCPCHGSRFQATGEVISGPAEKGLEKLAQ